jgi:hypothetical protein
MVSRFGQTDDPMAAEQTARACLVMPDAIEDLSLPGKLADRAIAIWGERSNLRRNERENLDWAQITKGMGEYRNGQFAAAVASLDKNWGPHRSEKDRFWREFAFLKRTTASLFLAMACQRMGQASEARRWLTQAQDVMQEQMPTNDFGDLVLWPDWLMCQIVRREAEALLNGTK